MKPDHRPPPDSLSPAGTRPSRSRRWLRRAGISLVTLASVTALFYGVENWRGAQAWNKTLNDLKLAGVKLLPSDFALPPVPDDQNMIMHPAFRCFTFTRPDGSRARRLEGTPPDAQDEDMAARWNAMEKERHTDGAFLIDEMRDLRKAPEREPAAMAALAEKLRPMVTRHRELLESVREAAERDAARWPQPGAYSANVGDFYAEWAHSEINGKFLALARVADAASLTAVCAGETESAWKNAACVARLARYRTAGIRGMIGLLISTALEEIETEMVVRLLEEPGTDPARCSAYEKDIAARPAFTEELPDAMESELALSRALFDWVFFEPGRTEEAYRNTMVMNVPYLNSRTVALLPGGWCRQNAAACLEMDNDVLTALRSGATPARHMEALDNYLQGPAQTRHGLVYGYLARRRALTYGSIGPVFLRADTKRVLLRVALAAARHRAATGKTPMSLDELSVEFPNGVPRGLSHDDLPVISRNGNGAWTVTCLGYGENPKADKNPSLRIRGW